MPKTLPVSVSGAPTKVRLDKWLWAARFYKTRTIAKQSIQAGKVYCDGARSKPSKEITLGAHISLRQGFDEKTVIVSELSHKRGNALEAQSLYEETAESIKRREERAAQRKAHSRHWHSPTRPNKKQRRLIQRFKQGKTD